MKYLAYCTECSEQFIPMAEVQDFCTLSCCRRYHANHPEASIA